MPELQCGHRTVVRARTVREILGRWLPPACVVCGRALETRQAPVCGLCWHRLPHLVPPRCDRCGATRSPLRGDPGGSCPECEGWPEGLRAAAPFRMEGVASTLVHALKYGRWEELARPMGRAMVESAWRLCPREANAPGLVPVPLAPARRRERGFNQAHSLAGSLAELTGWPLVPCLERRGGGRRQARLNLGGRLGNAMGRFHVQESSRRGISRRVRAVLIVDDVVTTGSTAAACARALTQAGSRPVGVVSFARALRPLDGR